MLFFQMRDVECVMSTPSLEFLSRFVTISLSATPPPPWVRDLIFEWPPIYVDYFNKNKSMIRNISTKKKTYRLIEQLNRLFTSC